MYVSKDGDSTLETSIPNVDLRRAVVLLEEYKFMKLEIQAKDEALVKLAQEVNRQNKTLADYRKRIADHIALDNAQKEKIRILTEQRDLAAANLVIVKKDNRKQKTLKWVLGGGALAALLSTVYFAAK